MNILQPLENPNIPVNLTREIESVRNQITLGQAEVDRLSALAISEQYVVGEIGKQKTELLKQLDELNSAIVAATDNLNALKEQAENLNASNIEMDKIIIEKNNTLSERENLLNGKADELRTLEENLQNNLNDLQERVRSFESDKSVLDTKIKAFNEFIDRYVNV